jgi:hypothetical protein
MALQEGITEGSRAYIDFINNTLDDVYGTGHESTKGSVQNRASSSAARPSRGDDMGDIGVGNLRISRDSEGKERLHGTIPQDWVEGASICGMDPVAYAIEQIKIDAAAKRGESAGMQVGEGVVYR